MNESHTTIEVPDDARPDSSGPRRSFEDECIDLLCKQENTLSQLSEAHSKSRLLDSLDLAKRMVVEFLDFAETHFKDEEIRDVAERLQGVYQETKGHEKQLCSQAFKSLKKMVGMDVLSEEEIRDAHQALRSKYVELYGEFFAICVKRFPDDSPTKQDFLQSVETFVRELDRRW